MLFRSLEDSQLPNEVDVLLDMEYETLSDLNELAGATDGLSKADMEKLGAVVTLAEPKLSLIHIYSLFETSQNPLSKQQPYLLPSSPSIYGKTASTSTDSRSA